MAQWLTSPTRNHEVVVRFLPLLSGLMIPGQRGWQTRPWAMRARAIRGHGDHTGSVLWEQPHKVIRRAGAAGAGRRVALTPRGRVRRSPREETI